MPFSWSFCFFCTLLLFTVSPSELNAHWKDNGMSSGLEWPLHLLLLWQHVGKLKQEDREEEQSEQRQEEGGLIEGGKSGSVHGTELKGSYHNEGIQTREARREDPYLKSNQFFKYNIWPNTDWGTLFQRSYMRHLSANYWELFKGCAYDLNPRH